MKLKSLFEAIPLETHLAKTYYHGTSLESAFNEILKHGLKPGDVTLMQQTSKAKENLNPVKGKVYITSDIGYAQMYAIGGDIAGSSYLPKDRKHGYLFVIDGAELKDIQPDEDKVGELIYKAFRRELFDPVVSRYVSLASKKLTDRQFKKFADAEYLMWAHLGKKLLQDMSDADKLHFIELSSNIAHGGNLNFKEAWKIDLSKIPELKRDGSNFFDLAEKVK
jgi:hypothetical protein